MVQRSRHFTSLILMAIFLVAAIVYLRGARANARDVNLDRTTTDQSAYMNIAARMHDTRYAVVGDRNRMPAYPFLLSLLYRPADTEEQFFERAKRLNILLSMVLLAGLFFVLRSRLPTFLAANVLLITAFTVFLFKAAYVQCELLYYALSFLTFLLMLDLLSRPDWKRALLIGGLAGIAHLTKASMLPGVLIFLALAAVWFTLPLSHRLAGPSDRFRWTGLTTVLIVALSFLTVLFPYLSTSKRVFGRYFYNVNSTFYMWYDSMDEWTTGTRLHGDRAGWPEMPPEEIPSASKYFREHSAAQIRDRIVKGLRVMGRNATHSYGYIKYLALFGVGAMICFARTRFTSAPPGPATGIQAAFCVIYLGSYMLLFAWFSAWNWAINRLSLQIFLPVLYLLALTIARWVPAMPSLRVPGGSAKPLTLFNLLTLAVLLPDIYLILTDRILTTYGGD